MTLSGLEKISRAAEPMAMHTTFRIGGPAEALVVPRSLEELRSVVLMCRQLGLPMHVLGRGSNLLVADDGVDGVVVLTRRLNRMERRGSVVVAQAGVFLPRLVKRAAAWGLDGLAPLTGIPGTLGGAVVMNAGGQLGTIASLLRSVTVIDRDGVVRTLARDDLVFGHRSSNLGDAVLAEAELVLSPSSPSSVSARTETVLADKKRSQPMSLRSAGCVFRNPPGQSAGELIDLAQMKSARVGRASISSKHANFIVNRGGACARDVRALMHEVCERVAERFDVHLQPELQMWGFDQRQHGPT